MCRALCFFIGLQLMSFAVLAQDTIGVSHSLCFTTDIAENQREPQNFFYPNLNRNGLRNASWNLNQGYGTSCTNDCIMTTAASCSKFRIPVVFTVSTQPGCGNSAPTQANIDAQIAITNDFYACQNVPIEFYKSTTYSGHPTTGDMSTRSQNIGCTYSASVLNDVPNVLNIYIFNNTSYGTSPNGWAYMPTGTTAPLLVIMSRTAFNGFSYTPGTLNCTTPNLGLSIVLIHELGHILGLHHTHNELNATKECPDMSNGCTGGDYITDTDADPGLHLTCANGSGCNKSPNACTSPCATPYPTDINTENNIMSYNNGSNCRTTFTTCQKAKLLDGLLCARGPQMCDRNVNLEFSNGSEDTYVELCVGDPAPIFVPSACYAWYATLSRYHYLPIHLVLLHLLDQEQDS
ncbi:MAG: M43 family zinc metalloprotease [Saprospiraceae bacterium]